MNARQRRWSSPSLLSGEYAIQSWKAPPVTPRSSIISTKFTCSRGSASRARTCSWSMTMAVPSSVRTTLPWTRDRARVPMGSAAKSTRSRCSVMATIQLDRDEGDQRHVAAPIPAPTPCVRWPRDLADPPRAAARGPRAAPPGREQADPALRPLPDGVDGPPPAGRRGDPHRGRRVGPAAPPTRDNDRAVPRTPLDPWRRLRPRHRRPGRPHLPADRPPARGGRRRRGVPARPRAPVPRPARRLPRRTGMAGGPGRGRRRTGGDRRRERGWRPGRGPGAPGPRPR